MYLAIIKSRASIGINAQSISVEVHISNGNPAFTIVGLAETAVKESKDRVRSAIITSRFDFPYKKITVNLAPADLKKIGGGFDLPIAIGILAASRQIPSSKLSSHEFIGELSLDGMIRPVNGIVPGVFAAYKENQKIIISKENANEASIINKGHILTASNLREVCSYLTQSTPLEVLAQKEVKNTYKSNLDWSDIRGQNHAKFALEIAAAGGHSVLLSGPPGSGKTMLATRFNTLLPLLNETQAFECAAIQSIRGKIPDFTNCYLPAFRAPHHTASPVALVGGGSPPKPGEISLAHNGVLFLDELPEFNRFVLETLRQPLESGVITISRATSQVDFPANFQFIAAMNPCPCGYFGDPKNDCLCNPERINRYLAKLSGPLLDRIDMHIHITGVDQEELCKPTLNNSPTSEIIRDKIIQIHQFQKNRQGSLNARLSIKNLEKFCILKSNEQTFINSAMSNLKLSARAFHRIIKIARTIADLHKREQIHLQDLKLALSFRQNFKKI